MPDATLSTDTFSPFHPHEPNTPVVLDGDGRCLVCMGTVAVEALAQEVGRLGERLRTLRDAWDEHIATPHGDVEPLLRAAQEAVVGIEPHKTSAQLLREGLSQ